MPLKYLSNFCKSLEMPLINYKVKLILKYTKYFVLTAAGADNNDANSNNIIFIQSHKIICSCVTLPAGENQKLLKLHSKGFER